MFAWLSTQVSAAYRPVSLSDSLFKLQSKLAPSLMQGAPYQPQFPRQLSNSESISKLIIVKRMNWQLSTKKRKVKRLLDVSHKRWETGLTSSSGWKPGADRWTTSFLNFFPQLRTAAPGCFVVTSVSWTAGCLGKITVWSVASQIGRQLCRTRSRHCD